MDFFKFLFVIIEFIVVIKRIHSIVTLRCKDPVFENGFIKIQERHVQYIEYFCNPKYSMIGNKNSMCVRGQWNDPVPLCIKPGCIDVITPKNGVIIPTNNGASLLLFCKSGYSLVGSQFAFCTGTVWNRSIGSCRKSQTHHSLSCHFEESTNCDWVSDYTQDFKWLRKNGYTSANQLGGPAYDHTIGIPLKGHFMLATMAKSLPSSTARLISPVYPANVSENACIRFYYHMYHTPGVLRVYVKPVSTEITEIFHGSKYLVMDIKGSFSNFWFEYINNIDQYDEDFQIIIEATSNSDALSNIAIDDVALFNGIKCGYEGTFVFPEEDVSTVDLRDSAKTTIQLTSSTALSTTTSTSIKTTSKSTTKYIKTHERITIPSTISTPVSTSRRITPAIQTTPAILFTSALQTTSKSTTKSFKPIERITVSSVILTPVSTSKKTTPAIPTTPVISSTSDIPRAYDIPRTSDVPTSPDVQTTTDIPVTSTNDPSTTTYSVPLEFNRKYETENDESQVADGTLSKESKILIIVFGILLIVAMIAVASIITFKLFNKYKKHTYICNIYSKDGMRMEVRR